MRNRGNSVNLNLLKIRNADGPDEPLRDLSIMNGKVSAYFRDIETWFVRHCHEAHAIVGCVAWLTNETMLRAMADLEAVSLIVQKEDFLRWDSGSKAENWKWDLRLRYNRLKGSSRFILDGLGDLSVCSDDSVYPARCVGNHNSSKKIVHPRMHNKFVVFCRRIERTVEEVFGEHYVRGPRYEPYAVWTGSFNFSENGTRSFENVVVIEDPIIAQAYYEEWAQIAALSEPLDWFSEWCEPEWRIGT